MDAQLNRSPAGCLLLILIVATLVFTLINAPDLIALINMPGIPVTGPTSMPTALAPTGEVSAVERTRTALDNATRLQQAQAAQIEQQRRLEHDRIEATQQVVQATRQAWQETAQVSQTSMAMMHDLSAVRATQMANEQADAVLTRDTLMMEAVVILCVGAAAVIVILAGAWALRMLWESRRQEAQAAAQKLEQQRLLEESRRLISLRLTEPRSKRKNGHFPGKIPAQSCATVEQGGAAHHNLPHAE